MSFHLDTNAAIGVINGRPASIRDRLRHEQQLGTPIAISVVVLFELHYGIARSQHRAANAERLRIFLSGAVDVIPFDSADAAIAGDIRAILRGRGTPIGPYDLLIAGQALRHGATLVTANTTEFARVPGLQRVDWSNAVSGPSSSP